MYKEVISMLLALLATAGVIVLTYYATKWYAKRFNVVAGSKHIKVIDRLIVGKTASIVIIEVSGIQYMVGVSDGSVRIMKELDIPVPPESIQLLNQQSFIKAFKSVIHKEKIDE